MTEPDQNPTRPLPGTRNIPQQPRRLEMDIPRLPKLLNELLRGHWRVKHAHAIHWKSLVKTECLCWRGQPAERARITATRYSSVEPDHDNLTGSFKCLIDGLKEARVIVDDKRTHVQVTYEWDKAAPGKGYVRIVVEEVLEPETPKGT